MRVSVLASALVLALVPGPASATHGAGDPTSVTMEVFGGGHAGECHRVEITATSNGAAAESEPIDVSISMSDADLVRDVSVEFCDPSQAWSSPGTGTKDCDDDAVFANESDTATGCGSGQTGTQNPARATEECVTDAAGRCVLGVRGSETEFLSIVAFFDSDGDDQRDSVEVSDEETRGLAVDREAVRTLQCAPSSDVDPEGSRHEFRCRAISASGIGVSDRTVLFDVISGPNAEEVGPTQCGPTDQEGYTPMTTPEDAAGGHPAGSASSACGYTDATGSGSPEGTDEIVAWVNTEDPPPGEVDDPNTATPGEEAQVNISVSWAPPPGSGRTIACTPDGGAGQLGRHVDVTCSVRNAGREPIPGVIVSFIEEGPGTFSGGSSSTSCATQSDGSCTVQMVTSTNESGTTTITGSITHSTCGSTVSDCADDATIQWTDQHFTWDAEIVLRYSRSRHRFTGTLTSDAAMCRAGRTVWIKKVRPGRNRRVAQTVTSEAGTFTTRRFADPRGRFYAFAPEISQSGDTCLAARSEQIRLRRR